MPDILSSIESPPKGMSRAALVLTVVCATAAAWLSQGTLALTGTGTARVALLPVSGTAWLLVGVTAAAVIVTRRFGASRAPYGLLVLLFLPWVPGAPAVF